MRDRPDSSRGGVRACAATRWAPAALVLSAAALVYGPVAAGLIRQWLEDPDAAYGLVVAGAAVVAFARQLPVVRRLPKRGAAWGVVGLAAASTLYAVGTLAADVFLVRLSLPILAAATVLFVGGASHLRALAAPLALSAIAIPPPSAVVTEITLPLQLMASQCAAGVLGLAGIPVVRDGNVLTLSYITLEVAEACSGMRSLVTLFALLAVYTWARALSLGRAAVLAAAVIPVALVGNGLRVAATAMLAARIGADATRGVAHDLTGWVAFVLMGLALVWIHRLTTRRAAPAAMAQAV